MKWTWLKSDDIHESNFFLYTNRTKHTTEFFCLINRDLDANTAVIQGLILSFKCVNHKHGGCFTTFYIAVVLRNSRGGFRVELKPIKTHGNIEHIESIYLRIKIESNPVCSRFKVRIFERVCSWILVDKL